VVLPLLSWGYHLRSDEWFARLDALEAAGARLANPGSVLRWNTTKTYLADLAAKGAPVVPTHAVDRLTMEALDHARDVFGVDVLVTKPQISGGSQDTVKLRHADGLAGCTTGPALIQPFLPAVGEEGELSLFYFDGVFSHAVTKVADGGRLPRPAAVRRPGQRRRARARGPARGRDGAEGGRRAPDLRPDRPDPRPGRRAAADGAGGHRAGPVPGTRARRRRGVRGGGGAGALAVLPLWRLDGVGPI
jgi:hypothetical protein